MIHRVILFSGGRTSGYMLRRLIDATPNFAARFKVIFCNTGKERTETLDFVHEVEERWSINVVWLEYCRIPATEITPGIFPTKRRNLNLQKAADAGESAHWFKVVDFDSASRKGEPFDELLNWMSILPNVTARVCSTQLKIRTAMRYLFSEGVSEYYPYIGIRSDEASRSDEILNSVDSFEHPVFPLIDSGITEKDVLTFWANNDFDLQLQSCEGNCDLCFLKAKWKRVLIAREHPEYLDWWINWERKKEETALGGGKVFRLGQPYELIKHLSSQPELALEKPSEKDIPCSCAVAGFIKDEEV